MSKRGQITVFIVIGIIILIVAGVFLYSQDKKIAEKPTTINTAPITSFVEQCLKSTAKDAIILTSLQGGYYQVPQPAADQIFVKIPYYFDFGQKHFPEKKTIEKQVEDYLVAKLSTCLNNFIIFKKEGFEITEGEMKAQVNLNRKTTFELNYPLKIKKGESIKELNKFTYSLNLNFDEIYSILNGTVVEHQKNPNYVPIGHLSLAAHKNNFTFDLAYLKNNVVLYSYVFDQYKIDKQNYTFIFASRYNWSELVAKKELDYVQEVEDQHCYVGDVCSYNLNIYEDNFTFVDYTNLFDVSSDGWIKFIPQQKDVGNYSILIKVNDSMGAEKYLSFGLELLVLNNSPEIKKIQNQTAKVNQIFTYKINATDPEGDKLIFYDDTDLFNISSTGLINFTAQNESLGFNIIEIIVSDGEFNDTGWLYLDVKNE